MSKAKPRLTSLFFFLFWSTLIFIWGVLSLNIFWDLIYPTGKIELQENKPVEGSYNYLIIAREKLQDSAYEWAQYRGKDYQVKVVILDEPVIVSSEQMLSEIQRRSSGLDIDELDSKLPEIVDTVIAESRYKEQSDRDYSREIIQEVIQDTYFQSGEPYPFYVLLIGSDDLAQLSYLPYHRYQVPVDKAEFLPFTEIRGDSGYTFDEKNNRWLPIAIGRIPLDDNSSVLSKLKSAQEYENNPVGGIENAQMSLVASDAGWGDAFAALTESGMQNLIKTELSPDFNYRIINGNYKSIYSLPAAMYSPLIVETLQNQSLWFSYVGHGGGGMGPARIAEEKYASMLLPEDLSTIENAQNTIMTFVACETDSLAKSLFSSETGPVATLSSSSITFAYPNTFLQKDLMLLLINDQIETVGEWTRLAEQGYFMPEMNRSFLFWFVRSYLDKIFDLVLGPDEEGCTVTENDLIDYQNYAYNLFGDPALRISHPKRDIKIKGKPSFALNNTRIAFRGESNLKEGTTILIYIKYYPGNIPFIEKAEEQNSLETFNLANSFTLNATSVKVGQDGDFGGEINVSVPASDVYILEATALSSPSSTGYDKVYVGFPVHLVFSNAKTWWILILFLVISGIVRKRKNKSL